MGGAGGRGGLAAGGGAGGRGRAPGGGASRTVSRGFSGLSLGGVRFRKWVSHGQSASPWTSSDTQTAIQIVGTVTLSRRQTGRSNESQGLLKGIMVQL